jgi:glycosyltransferase involved in cell wall biosynthesis
MNLLYYNLCLDKDYAPLEFNIEWLNQIALSYKNVFVITKYNNDLKFKKNILVFPLLKYKEENPSKISLLIRFYKFLFHILFKYKIKRCFSHMNPLYIVLSGLILRLIKVKIILWYTHPAVTLKLKLAYFFSNKIVSASKESFKYKKNKLLVLGHFVDDSIFTYNRKIIKSNEIVYAGRISRIKNISYILKLFQSLDSKNSFKLILVGSCVTKRDLTYKNELLKYIEYYNISHLVRFIDFVKRDNLSVIFKNASYFINVTDKGSFDKVILEASLCGAICLVSNDFLSNQLYGEDFTLTMDLKRDINTINKLIEFDLGAKNELIKKQIEIVKKQYSIKNLSYRLDQAFS